LEDGVPSFMEPCFLCWMDGVLTRLPAAGRALAPLLPAEAELPEEAGLPEEAELPEGAEPFAVTGALAGGVLGLVLGGGFRLGRLGM
jgi:hypothetical protein